MQRPKVYISGPLSEGGKSPTWKRTEHCEFAAHVMLNLIEKRFAVLCPHLTEWAERLTNRHLPHAVWIENDLPWIEVSDALYRLPGDSAGADLEVEHAIKLEIPVFRDLLSLHAHFKALGRVP